MRPDLQTDGLCDLSQCWCNSWFCCFAPSGGAAASLAYRPSSSVTHRMHARRFSAVGARLEFRVRVGEAVFGTEDRREGRPTTSNDRHSGIPACDAAAGQHLPPICMPSSITGSPEDRRLRCCCRNPCVHACNPAAGCGSHPYLTFAARIGTEKGRVRDAVVRTVPTS